MRRSSKYQNFARFARRNFLFNCVATIIAVLLGAARNGWETALTFESIFTSFVYSVCIGTIINLIVTVGIPSWRRNTSFVRLGKFTTAIFVGTFVGILLANAILALLNLESWATVLSLSWPLLILSLVIAFGLGFSAYFYEASQTRLAHARALLQQRELDAARAETLATEAQLASLESRLHPHFLFNTLNSIAALIREDTILAEKTVEQLASLLRYSLDANTNRLVTLRQEIKITRDYLEIERVRFGDRLQFSIAVDERFLTVKVPPFALQTLVENSIKHVASKRPGAIEIVVSARAKAEYLEIEVCDDGNGFSAQNIKNNHGLDNLQKRLMTIFADQAAAALEIKKNNDHGRVTFRVPLNEENATEITARVFN